MRTSGNLNTASKSSVQTWLDTQKKNNKLENITETKMNKKTKAIYLKDQPTPISVSNQTLNVTKEVQNK